MITVKGVSAAISTVRKRAEQEAEKWASIITESAVNIQRYAKETAPVRTGNLRNSIQAEFFSKWKAYVKAYAPYAAFVEYGTSRMRARPYMRTAVERERARLRSLKWR